METKTVQARAKVVPAVVDGILIPVDVKLVALVVAKVAARARGPVERNNISMSFLDGRGNISNAFYL